MGIFYNFDMKKMFIYAPFLFFLLTVDVSLLAAGGQEEAAASSGLGEYLAESGKIIPASDVRINSYIAKIDYNYPRPEKDLSVTFVSGGSHIPEKPGPLLFQAGIQGRESPFEKLPPFNIVFLIDSSGSMAGADKLPLALRGATLTLERMRPFDRIGVITAAGEVEPDISTSRLLDTEYNRIMIESYLQNISAYGTSNVYKGLALAFQEVENHYNPKGINRVLLLSDGQFDGEEALILAEEYRSKGINLTTIGFGQDFNSSLMIQLSKNGGGSSRFVSDADDIRETFYDDFDRMTVPVARDLMMTFTLHLEADGLETWGYRNQINGPVITYSLPTLHHRDYETILVEASFPPPDWEGRRKAATFTLSYSNLEGKRIELEPLDVYLNYDRNLPTPELYADPYVLKSSSMLDFARNLIDISRLFDAAQKRQAYIYDRGNLNFRVPNLEQYELPGIDQNNLESMEMIRFNYEHALDLVLISWRRFKDAETRLGIELFEDERSILYHYVNTIARNLGYSQTEIEAFRGGEIVRVPAREDNLSAELALLADTLLHTLPPGSSLLFPGIIAEGSEIPTGANSVFRRAAAAADIILIEPIEGTILSEYKDTPAAIMAGKSTASDYVAVIIAIRAGGRTILFGKILSTREGIVIRSSQRVFSDII
jgi:hypothetical protein